MSQFCFRELEPYALTDIACALDINLSRVGEIIRHLLAQGIMNRRDSNVDNLETDEVEVISPDAVWQFCYVGIVIVDDVVMTVYPKYFKSRQPSGDEMRQILQVLRRLPHKMQVSIYSYDICQSSNQLPLMLELLDRYMEYGVYENYIDAYEPNGRGVIDWSRTINKHLPVLAEDGPIYIEYEARKNKRNDSDFVTRLHRAVLTECSQQLSAWGIADLFSIGEIYLSGEPVGEFGEIDILERCLSRECSTQFITWKQSVLGLLKTYLLNRNSSGESTDIACMGTTNFYYVWESACKTAFGDKLHTKLDKLDIRLNSVWLHSKNKKLIEIISRPKWEYVDKQIFKSCNTVSTLIPDAVTIRKKEDNTTVFCIYDAKYYVPTVAINIKNQPGVEAIAKQFLYQSAFRDFVIDHNCQEVINTFLIPTADDKASNDARVSFPGVISEEQPPFSNYINMWRLPAAEIFSAYLNDRRLDDDLFRELWDMSARDSNQ